jgi:hypothetical protein
MGMKNPRAVVCHWQIAFVTSKDLVAPLTRITKGDLSVEIDFDNFDSAVCGARTDFEFKRLAAAAVWHAGCFFHGRTENSMLKISVVDSRTQCRLVLEGRLVAPWVEELRTAWKRAKAELNGRELVIDMGSVIVASQEAENALLQMMNEGARFRFSGVLTRHLLQQLRQRSRKNPAQADIGDKKCKE